MLSLLNLLLQVVLTHLLLGGAFLPYGFKFTYSASDRSSVVPFQDYVFPKMSKCPMHLFGPSGTRQLYDGLCVLPLNLLHDKVKKSIFKKADHLLKMPAFEGLPPLVVLVLLPPACHCRLPRLLDLPLHQQVIPVSYFFLKETHLRIFLLNSSLKHIERHLKGHALGNRLRPFNATFGDWLVLHHLYKNLEHAHFLQLVNRFMVENLN